MFSTDQGQVERKQIVLDVEWRARATNQNTRGPPKINTESSWGEWSWAGWCARMPVAAFMRVWWVRTRAGWVGGALLPPPPPRNISKIATTNQTKCKSALWKESKKKSLEGRRKNRYSFQPIYSSRSAEMGHSTPAPLELLKQDSRFYFLE